MINQLKVRQVRTGKATTQPGDVRRIYHENGIVEGRYPTFQGLVYANLEISGDFVYFINAGTQIQRLLKTGGIVRTVAGARFAVSDLYVHTTVNRATVYWSEEGGAVKIGVVEDSLFTYQPTLTGRRAATVGVDGSRVFWIDCNPTSGWSNTCSLRKWQGGITTTLGTTAWDAAKDLVWDASQVLWGSRYGIEKYVHEC